MDFKHIPEITTAGLKNYTELKALCVWVKRNGGMGICIGRAMNWCLCVRTGAPYTPIMSSWDGTGDTALTCGNMLARVALALPVMRTSPLIPRSKPVGLIADAIRDRSKRGDVILDPFAGSGTLLLAAERTGRKAAAIELDPTMSIRRFADGRRPQANALTCRLPARRSTRSLNAWQPLRKRRAKVSPLRPTMAEGTGCVCQ